MKEREKKLCMERIEDYLHIVCYALYDNPILNKQQQKKEKENNNIKCMVKVNRR